MTDASPQRSILVTGGAGFIGSHLVEALLSRGDRVTIVDDLSTGSEANLATARAAGPGRVEFLRGTVGAILPTMQGRRFDEIYHLAAAVGVRLVVEEPVRTIETNVLETSAVLGFAARTRTPVLVASTSEVYGKGARTPFREEDDLVFGPSTVSRWCYGISKAVDEHLALAHARREGLPAVVARFFNTVGPRQTGQYGMVLPRFVEAALAGRPLQVHGDGLQARCFCDVRDVAPALPRMLAAPACHGGVFNVGGDRIITVLELAETVRRVTGSASAIEFITYAQAYGGSFEDLRVRQPDLSRIRAAIGFEARIPLERTIADVAAQVAGAAGASAGGAR
ncbi:MAG: GDP-mannose 4,6-dehydratase [Phycisphaerales bacterium]